MSEWVSANTVHWKTRRFSDGRYIVDVIINQSGEATDEFGLFRTKERQRVRSGKLPYMATGSALLKAKNICGKHYFNAREVEKLTGIWMIENPDNDYE